MLVRLEGTPNRFEFGISKGGKLVSAISGNAEGFGARVCVVIGRAGSHEIEARGVEGDAGAIYSSGHLRACVGSHLPSHGEQITFGVKAV